MPSLVQPAGGTRQLCGTRGSRFRRHTVRPGEIFRENQSSQPQPLCRRRIDRANRDEIRPKPMNDQALGMTKGLHPGQHTGSVMQFAQRHVIAQFGRELFPHVGHPGLSGPFGRGPLLQSPVWDLHKATPGRIAGISPAEAQIQQIFEGIPRRTACRTGRINIEAAQVTIRTADPTRYQQVNFKPAQMGMCRGKDGWSESWRNAREGNF